MTTTEQATADDAPQSYGELRGRILARHAGLSRQLQKIARFAVDHPDIMALESVASVARTAEVQPSAIVRFAQALGLDGFGSLQRLFRQNLMAREDGYRERIRTLAQVRSGAPVRLLDDLAQAAIRSLETLRLETPQARLDAAVAVLRAADEVFVFGQRRSFAVAQYLNYALLRLECRNVLVTGAGGMADQQLARCRPGSDAILAVSFAPYARGVVERVRELAEAGTPVVAITDSPLSPLVPSSTVHFEVSGGDHPFRSLVAPICLAQTLVVTLGETAGAPAP